MNISQLISVVGRLKGPFDLMGFAGKYEAEFMIWQILQAVKVNYEAGRGEYAYKGENSDSVCNGGLVDNAGGLYRILARGWVKEGVTDIVPVDPSCVYKNDDGYIILVPTQKLLTNLSEFLESKKEK